MSDIAALQAERDRLAARVHQIAQEGESEPGEFYRAVVEQGSVMRELSRAVRQQDAIPA